MQNPSLQCYEAAQSVLLYAGNTREFAIRFSATYSIPDGFTRQSESIRNKGGLYAFCDSTWTAPKSMCGYVVFMAGGPVVWSSRKLNVIADSTALAEYSCASACSKETHFLRNLLSGLRFEVNGPVVVGVHL